ncbi:MAG: co-chaperone GroES [Armatimonadota bacterium]
MLKPLGNRVLVKPLVAEETTSGGIVLPDTAQKKPQEGKVVAVGDGERLESGTVIPVPVKKGDVVIYPEFGGTEIRVGTEDYLIVEVDSLLAVKDAGKKPAKKKAAKKKARKKK